MFTRMSSPFLLFCESNIMCSWDFWVHYWSFQRMGSRNDLLLPYTALSLLIAATKLFATLRKLNMLPSCYLRLHDSLSTCVLWFELLSLFASLHKTNLLSEARLTYAGRHISKTRCSISFWCFENKDSFLYAWHTLVLVHNAWDLCLNIFLYWISYLMLAVSDYRQSLQFQNLNEEKWNIHLEVGFTALEYLLGFFFNFLYFLFTSCIISR